MSDFACVCGWFALLSLRVLWLLFGLSALGLRVAVFCDLICVVFGLWVFVSMFCVCSFVLFVW